MNIRSLHILLSMVLLCASPVHSALIVVNSTGDQPAVTPAVSPLTAVGTITFRSALQFAQANADASNTINFNIPIVDPGFSAVPIPHWTIKPNTTLLYNNITKTLTIDGYAGSPAGAAPNTDPVISNAVITIEVSGENIPGSSSGIALLFLVTTDPNGTTSTGSLAVRGLCLNRLVNSVVTTNPSFALRLTTQNSTWAGNFIGTDITGTSTQQVAGALQLQTFSFNNTIGGGTPADRNIIVGDLQGLGMISINANIVNGASTPYNKIQGNIMGLAKNGTNPLGINRLGIAFNGAHNLVGGPLTSHRNVIANTSDAAIEINTTSGRNVNVNNTIQNNYIGTDATGLLPRGAGARGIIIRGPANTIDSNLVTNATVANIVLTQGIGGRNNQVIRQALITNNRIGTDAPGLTSLSSSAIGILFAPLFEPGITTLDTFYGFYTISNNLISGNKIGIQTNTAANPLPYDTALISGNKIGTTISGLNPLPNLEAGVVITNSKHIALGGNDPALGNIISFNGGAGILLNERSSDNEILGNTINNNGNTGITVEFQSPDNTIGANELANNVGDAIIIHQQSNSNIIQGNAITGGTKGVVIGTTANDLSVNNAVISNTTIAP